MGSLSLLQEVFPIQGLLHCRQILYKPSYLGSPVFLTAYNSMSVSLLFCPITLQELPFTPNFPLTLCYIHPVRGVYPYNTLPLIVIRKETAEPPKHQLLGYRCQPMTVFEKMQEEEIKILSPLFLILCESLDSSWGRGTVLEGWAYWLPLSAS